VQEFVNERSGSISEEWDSILSSEEFSSPSRAYYNIDIHNYFVHRIRKREDTPTAPRTSVSKTIMETK
jgi:hypothetical protein